MDATDSQIACKSIGVSWFTEKRVDYSFVLLVSTRSIFDLPYSVNVTATNELWEVYKVLILAKTLCFMTFFPYSVIVTNTKRGYAAYLQNVDTSLYRRESTLKPKHTK